MSLNDHSLTIWVGWGYLTSGLLCARLKGNVVRAAYHLPYNQRATVDAHTIVGDKFTGVATGIRKVDNDGWPVDDLYHEIVLRHSSQCLPVIKFDKQIHSHKDGKKCMKFIIEELKGIMQEFFNKGLEPTKLNKSPFIVTPRPHPRPVQPTLLANAALPASTALLASALPGISATSNPPRASRRNGRVETLTYTAPQTLTMGVPSNALVEPSSSCNMENDCAICHVM